MSREDNIYLVGMMGAGKSSVGRLLALDMQKSFFDADEVLEARAGADISWIFALEGEAGFRAREKNVLEELLQADNAVVATGGGAILHPGMKEKLRARGMVIYLHCPPQALARRLRHDKTRPLLQVNDKKAKLDALYQERDPLYRQAAHILIEASGASSRALARTLKKRLCPS